MTNLERVIELVGQMGKVTIASDDGLFMMVMEIDSYDCYESGVSIGDLEGNEFIILKDNIRHISDEGVVALNQYTLVFEADKEKIEKNY